MFTELQSTCSDPSNSEFAVQNPSGNLIKMSKELVNTLKLEKRMILIWGIEQRFALIWLTDSLCGLKHQKTSPAVVVKPTLWRSVLIKTQWNSTRKYLWPKVKDWIDVINKHLPTPTKVLNTLIQCSINVSYWKKPSPAELSDQQET